MKKIIISLVISVLPLISFATDGTNDSLDESDRVYLTKDKGVWIFEDGFVIDPPFVSFWAGLNGKFESPKSQSSKILITFDCRKQRYRYEAEIEFSMPKNKGKRISEDYTVSRWWPVEPGSILNAMSKAACRRLE